jgi:hypothetical protein
LTVSGYGGIAIDNTSSYNDLRLSPSTNGSVSIGSTFCVSVRLKNSATDLVRGSLVVADSSTEGGVLLAGANSTTVVGSIVYFGSDTPCTSYGGICGVCTTGIAYVLSDGTCQKGEIANTGATAGSVTCGAAPVASQMIGSVLSDDTGAGTLTRILMHRN